MRICITGGPRTGKSTLARSLDLRADHNCAPAIYHTDDLINLGWSEASEAATHWLDSPGPWIIEGVAVSRAIRKWWSRGDSMKPPLDKMIILHDAFEDLSPGQLSMARGVETVTAEIIPWLKEEGVIIERRRWLNGGWLIQQDRIR